jgi:hypothetical protein
MKFNFYFYYLVISHTSKWTEFHEFIHKLSTLSNKLEVIEYGLESHLKVKIK